jgi:Spy/CpxP family protein refolding chaperone
MSRLRSSVVVAVFAALVAGVAAYAQGPGFGRGGPGPFGGRGGFGGPDAAGLPLRQIDLTETQQQQIRDVTQQYRDQNRQAAEQLRMAMDAQRTAVETMPVNEGLIRSTTQAIVEAQTALAIQRARMQSDIFALLTPAQQEQLKKLRVERESRGQQRGARGQQ